MSVMAGKGFEAQKKWMAHNLCVHCKQATHGEKAANGRDGFQARAAATPVNMNQDRGVCIRVVWRLSSSLQVTVPFCYVSGSRHKIDSSCQGVTQRSRGMLGEAPKTPTQK